MSHLPYGGSMPASVDTPHEGGSPVREFSSMFCQLGRAHVVL